MCVRLPQKRELNLASNQHYAATQHSSEQAAGRAHQEEHSYGLKRVRCLYGEQSGERKAAEERGYRDKWFCLSYDQRQGFAANSLRARGHDWWRRGTSKGWAETEVNWPLLPRTSATSTPCSTSRNLSPEVMAWLRKSGVRVSVEVVEDGVGGPPAATRGNVL